MDDGKVNRSRKEVESLLATRSLAQFNIHKTWSELVSECLIVGLSYGARNVLSYTSRTIQNFLAFRDSPIIPFRRSPVIQSP